MAAATVTSKGQVTLPREVRVSLGIVAGDRLDFIQMADGHYAIIRASHSIRSLKGIIPKLATSVTLDDMDKAIEAGARGE